MLCKRFKEICDEQGWTVSDNGSDPIILCKQNRQGFTYSFPASHKNFVEDVTKAKAFLSRNLSTYAKSVHEIFTKSIRLKSAWLRAKVSSILYLRYLPSLTNLKSQNKKEK